MMTNDDARAAQLHREWRTMLDRVNTSGSDTDERAEQTAYDALVDYVESHDLLYSIYDPRFTRA